MSLIIKRSLSRPYYFLQGEIDPVVFRAMRRALTYIPADAARRLEYRRRNEDGILEECLLGRAITGDWYFPVGVLGRVIEILDVIGMDYRVQNDVELPGDPLGLEWKTDKVLYDYQAEAAEIAYLNGGGTICLPTGGGKTLVCLRLIYAFDHRALVMVHSRELMRQWRDEIRRTFDIDPGLVGGGFKENWDDITVASIQTIASRVKRGKVDEIDLNYPVAVLDECLPYKTPVITDRGAIPIGVIVEQRLPVRVLTHAGRYRRVTAHHKIPLRNRLVRVIHDCGALDCTEDHKIYTQRGWVEAINLVGGDVVSALAEGWDGQDPGMSIFRPSGVCRVDISTDIPCACVYDLTVEEDHSFVASGICVSNCHRVPAQDSYTVAMLYNSPVRIGASATPYRTDGREMKIWGAIGDICVQITPVDLIRRGYLTRPRFVILDPPYVKMRKVNDWHDAYYDGIVANQYRNQMIVNTARSLVEDGHKVYIHVERIEHGDILAIMFDDVPFIHGTTPKAERDGTIAQFAGTELDCLISTLLGEGVDIPAMTAIIMAGGLKTQVGVVQKVGRALRLSPGKEEAIIVDFRDKGPWLSRHFQERMNVYRESYGEYVGGRR